MEIWEAVVTFLLFPILVYLAYLADKGLPWSKSRVSTVAGNGKQIELGSIQPGECKFVNPYNDSRKRNGHIKIERNTQSSNAEIFFSNLTLGSYIW